MLNGILLINKPKFSTSYSVVSKIKKIINQKKVGHAGTLDPIAIGLLPILLGNATKISSFFMSKTKEYIAILKLGIETDTQDITGNIINKSNSQISFDNINKILLEFIGIQKQIPPMFSAIKINGKKLYTLARMGKIINRDPREIQIYDINLIHYDINNQEFIIKVKCSKGTYIRTLCHDIGRRLKTYGVLKKLIRINIGNIFDIKNSYSLKKIMLLKTNDIKNILLPTEIIFEKMPELILNDLSCKKLKNGIDIILTAKHLEIENIIVKIKNNGKFLMLAKVKYINKNFLLTLYKNFISI